MNKKILDGTVTLLFCMSLIAASNIQEKEAGEPLPDRNRYSEVQSTADWNSSVAAGVSRIFSDNSFTTESDEKTDIEKREVVMVTSPAWVMEEEIASEGSEQEKEQSVQEGEQIVPAGLAQPGQKEHAADADRSAEIIEVKTVIAAAGPREVRTEIIKAVPSGMSASMKDVVAVRGQLAQAFAKEVREAAQAALEPAVSNRWGISLTDQEIDLLARIVWLEAGGEPVEGQEAVVEVIFNRMASDLYPDTLYDVLSQQNPVQFCSWRSRESAKPTEKEYQSIEQVLNGNTGILRNDTLYFSRKALTPRLDQRIGGHSFCY